MILTLDGGDRELESLAHDSLAVPSGDRTESGDRPGGGCRRCRSTWSATWSASRQARVPSQLRRGMRARLAQLLDTLSGPRES